MNSAAAQGSGPVSPADPAPELEPGDSAMHPMAPWFAKLRLKRRAARARAASIKARRTRAVVTIVHNEPVFLPIWLRYYSRFFAPEDIYVLDNDTSDGSTDGSAFVRIDAPHSSVDHTWMVRRIEQLQRELLERYEIVVVCDVDEIIAPTPSFGTLGTYLDRFDEPWVNCLGYELLHRVDSEPALDLRRPLLDQRHWWFHNGGYDKAAVTTAPVRWRPGFHGREDFQYALDPDLRLIHLHRMDYALCLARHRVRNRKPWARKDAEQRWAVHNQLTDEREFAQWFSNDCGFEGYSIVLEQVPPEWRGLL